jgi:hypothetical protein
MIATEIRSYYRTPKERDYIKKYNTLKSYYLSSKSVKGVNIIIALSFFREQYSKGELSDKHIEYFKSLGVNFNLGSRDDSFLDSEDKFVLLRQFCLVQKRLPVDGDCFEGHPVYNWYMSLLRNGKLNKKVKDALVRLKNKYTKNDKISINSLAYKKKKSKKTTIVKNVVAINSLRDLNFDEKFKKLYEFYDLYERKPKYGDVYDGYDMHGCLGAIRKKISYKSKKPAGIIEAEDLKLKLAKYSKYTISKRYSKFSLMSDSLKLKTAIKFIDDNSIAINDKEKTSIETFIRKNYNNDEIKKAKSITKISSNYKTKNENFDLFISVMKSTGVIGCMRHKKVSAWIRNQRRNKDRNLMSISQFKKLDENGFPWDGLSVYWDYHYCLFNEFVESICSIESIANIHKTKDILIKSFHPKAWLVKNLEEFDYLSKDKQLKLIKYKNLDLDLNKNQRVMLSDFYSIFGVSDSSYSKLKKDFVSIFQKIIKDNLSETANIMVANRIPEILGDNKLPSIRLSDEVGISRERVRQIYNYYYAFLIELMKNTADFSNSINEKINNSNINESTFYKYIEKTLTPSEVIIVNSLSKEGLSIYEIKDNFNMEFIDIFNCVHKVFEFMDKGCFYKVENNDLGYVYIHKSVNSRSEEDLLSVASSILYGTDDFINPRFTKITQSGTSVIKLNFEKIYEFNKLLEYVSGTDIAINDLRIIFNGSYNNRRFLRLWSNKGYPFSVEDIKLKLENLDGFLALTFGDWKILQK